MGERIEWISEPSRFAELGTAWDSLADQEGTPFSRHCWYAAWRAAFGRVGALRVCALWRDEELAGLFPLFAPRRGRLATMANVHTPVLRPLARDGAALTALASAVARSPAAELLVAPLPDPSDELEGVTEAAGSTGRLVALERLHTSPIVETGGEFDEWRRLTKPRWRVQLDRLRRKARGEHRAELELVRVPDDLDAELERGLRVEASGWKGKAGTAILSRPDTTRFYRSVARAFHERSELRLSGMRLDGGLAAFDLCLLSGNRLYLLKTGHDESYRRLAPGLVLRLSVIERCFELGLDALELLGDDAEWKRKFSTAERHHVGLRCVRPGSVAVLHHFYRQRIRPRLRRVYRSVRPSTPRG